MAVAGAIVVLAELEKGRGEKAGIGGEVVLIVMDDEATRVTA